MDARIQAAALALAASASLSALAEGTAASAGAAHRLGDHPAVIVARLEKDKPYDYAAQFYPHPARLAMLPKAPPEASAAPVAGANVPRKVAGTVGAPAKASPPAATETTSATAMVSGAVPGRD